MSSKPIDADRVKAAIPLLEFFCFELPNMPPPKTDTGWVDGGLCPFHPDRHKGNFRVNMDTGAYKCFACGNSGGDILAFAMKRYGLTFPDAVSALADAWGVRA